MMGSGAEEETNLNSPYPCKREGDLDCQDR
jgi:hypothetical protein